MSEFDDNVAKLLEQEKVLLLVIAEAEAKVEEYTKSLAEGKALLERVEGFLETIFGSKRTGMN